MNELNQNNYVVEETTENSNVPAPKKKAWLPLAIVAAAALVVIAVIIVVLFGGSPAEKVVKMVDSIGTVTMSSEKKIQKVEEAYAKLEAEEKGEVGNYSELIAARAAFDRIKKAYDAIEAIGTVTATTESGDLISAAKSAYDALNETEKEAVTNDDALADAEKKYEELKVDMIIGEIDKIGKVSLKSEEVVKTIREKYDDLTAEQQAKITNKDTLTTAEKTLKSLKKAEVDKYLSQMRKTTDDVRGITWYEPKALPTYIDVRSYALPYLAQDANGTSMYLRLDYTGDDWIFWKSIIFAVDGKNTTRSVGYFNIERDNDNGLVWEYADLLVGDAEIELLESIVASKKTVVRFQGDSYHYDLEVSASDKAAIRLVLDAYKALN